MGNYQKSITINATRQQIEDYVSNVKNLPKYLATTKNAEPQQGERVRVQGQSPTGQTYDSDGYFRMDKSRNRMEWGSDGEHQYSGWMEFKDASSSSSQPTEVTVHLSITPPKRMKEGMEQREGSADTAIEEGIEKSLQSLKNEIEGTGGKVDYR